MSDNTTKGQHSWAKAQNSYICIQIKNQINSQFIGSNELLPYLFYIIYLFGNENVNNIGNMGQFGQQEGFDYRDFVINGEVLKFSAVVDLLHFFYSIIVDSIHV